MVFGDEFIGGVHGFAAGVGGDAEEEAGEGAEAKVDAGDPAAGEGAELFPGEGGEGAGAVEGVEDGAVDTRGVAEHFILPDALGDAVVHGEEVGEGEEAGAFFGDAGAVFEEGTGGAGAVGGAGFHDVPDAPAEDFIGGLSDGEAFGVFDEFLHESANDVAGGDGFDGAANAGKGAGGELGSGPDLAVEEFDFVAADFLDAGATDGAVGLGEDFDGGVIFEFESFAGGLGGEELGEVGEEEGAEVGVHFFTLFEGAGEDADLDAGLEEEIEESGDGGDLGYYV